MNYGIGIYLSFLQDKYEAIELSIKHKMVALRTDRIENASKFIRTKYDRKHNIRHFIFLGIPGHPNDMIYARVYSPVGSILKRASYLADMIIQAVNKTYEDDRNIPPRDIKVTKLDVTVLKFDALYTSAGYPKRAIDQRFMAVLATPPGVELPPTHVFKDVFHALPSIDPLHIVVAVNKPLPSDFMRKDFYVPYVIERKSPSGRDTYYYVPLVE